MPARIDEHGNCRECCGGLTCMHCRPVDNPSQTARIADLEAALREIAKGDVDDGGYRRNHIAGTWIARRALGMDDY